MSQAHIRVEVASGMFSCEKAVSFRVGSTQYSMILDSSQIHEDTIAVSVLKHDEREALVELPVETLTYGKRVWIPLDLLVSPDPLQPQNQRCAKEWAN
jgi:hypothetical protein